MKKYLTIFVFGLLIWSCGSDDGGDPPPTPENRPPTTPNLISPTNNQLCIDPTVEFEWTASSDPDGDAIKYQLVVATDNGFTQTAHSIDNIVGTSYTISLEKGVAYYWKVRAKDSKNAYSEFSTVFQFYTEAEGAVNHLPFSPQLISPNLSEVVQETSTTLSWDASDVDTEDNLTFDVYFGTVNPPTSSELVSENQSEKTFDVNLESSTNYYWKIVVKDNNGGQTFGQVWGFKTD